jgi:hypothetical protein
MTQSAAKRQKLSRLQLHEAVAAPEGAVIRKLKQLLKQDEIDCAEHNWEPLLAQQDSLGRTPLHVAAELPGLISYACETWETLIAETPVLQRAAAKQDAAGRTVLHVLIALNQWHPLTTLLYSYSNLAKVQPLLDMQDHNGVTAVALAQQMQCVPIMVQLGRHWEQVMQSAYCSCICTCICMA